MKIAYLFEKFPSATETFLAREVEALRQEGFEIEVWALEAGVGAQKIPSPPRALKLMGRQNYRRTQGRLLAEQLKNCNVQHIHATWANHIAELGGFAAQELELPWSFAAHARDLWVDGGDLKAKLASARFGATCTCAGEKELRRFGDNVLYAPHGLQLEEYEFQPWNPDGEMRLLGVGRLIEKKGWLDLIEAAGQLKEQGKRVSVQIIGEGPQRGELEQRVDGLNLNQEVRLLGAMPHGAVVATMKRSNGFVLPSRITRDGDRDGLANVLLEAGAIGLPIVTTDAGAARDFVDEATGRVVVAGDSAALVEAIEHVFSEIEETRQRCSMARQRVEQDFDVAKNVAVLGRAFRGESW